MKEAENINQYIEYLKNKYQQFFESERRHSILVLFRAAMAYELRRLGLGYKEIGRILRRDHSTVMYLLGRHPRCKETYDHIHKLVTALDGYSNVNDAIASKDFYRQLPPLYRDIIYKHGWSKEYAKVSI